jgi:hypothetical protein
MELLMICKNRIEMSNAPHQLGLQFRCASLPAGCAERELPNHQYSKM